MEECFKSRFIIVVLEWKSSIDGFFYFVLCLELSKFIKCPERHFITYRALIYVVCKLKSILSFPLFSIIHLFMSSNRYNHLYTSCIKALSVVLMPIDMITEVEIDMISFMSKKKWLLVRNRRLRISSNIGCRKSSVKDNRVEEPGTKTSRFWRVQAQWRSAQK